MVATNTPQGICNLGVCLYEFAVTFRKVCGLTDKLRSYIPASNMAFPHHYPIANVALSNIGNGIRETVDL